MELPSKYFFAFLVLHFQGWVTGLKVIREGRGEKNERISLESSVIRIHTFGPIQCPSPETVDKSQKALPCSGHSGGRYKSEFYFRFSLSIC